MKRILISIIFIFVSLGVKGHSNDQDYPSKDCDEIFIGVVQLLKEADNHWDDLESMSENSTEADKLAEELYWFTSIAANYTTVYEAFCKN